MLNQKTQIVFLLSIQVIFCFVFFQYAPIDFECDAALNFSYGKTIYNLISGNWPTPFAAFDSTPPCIRELHEHSADFGASQRY